MKVIETEIPEVKVIELQRHPDNRGYFVETYDRARYEAAGITEHFVLDGQSLSEMAGTVRGMHFQVPPLSQAKLVICDQGSVFDVVLDIRVGSPTYGRHVCMELKAGDLKQLYIPDGFAHGFLTLEADTRILYKLANPYSPEHAKGVRWNDPDLNIPWPEIAGDPVLSEADRNHPLLKDFPPAFDMGSA